VAREHYEKQKTIHERRVFRGLQIIYHARITEKITPATQTIQIPLGEGDSTTKITPPATSSQGR
jgi:choline/glycine/proline betaine transport protein